MIANLPFQIFTASKQLISGNHENNVSNLLTSYQGSPGTPVTALAGGGRPGSPVLNGAFVHLTTVATIADSVQLPIAKVGLRVMVTNDGAASAQIFGNGTDTVAGAAGSVGVALAAGATALFVCSKDAGSGQGVWNRFVSA